MMCRMTEMRKVTAFLPAKLLDAVQAGTGQGVTETLRIALQQLAHNQACDRLLALEGKVDMSDFDLEVLREDRDLDSMGPPA
jgi:hypothetical protein